MSFIKKQSVGFYFAALAVIAAVVATVFYLINCNTAYFSNLGVNAVIVGCLIVAIVLELVYIIGYNKVGVSLVMWRADDGGVRTVHYSTCQQYCNNPFFREKCTDNE